MQNRGRRARNFRVCLLIKVPSHWGESAANQKHALFFVRDDLCARSSSIFLILAGQYNPYRKRREVFNPVIKKFQLFPQRLARSLEENTIKILAESLVSRRKFHFLFLGSQLHSSPSVAYVYLIYQSWNFAPEHLFIATRAFLIFHARNIFHLISHVRTLLPV
jgi:hypothetical protein